MSEATQTAAAVEAEKIVLRFYEALNTGDAALIGEVTSDLLAPDWKNNPLPPGGAPGRESFAPTVGWLRSVFPDLTIGHEDIVASADGTKVAVRSVSRGTHKGEILGVPATGRTVQYRAFDIHHLEDGRIVQSWHLEDFFALLSQLGAQFSTSA
ncbi:ester cyclase [Streptomyces sp. NPDC001185]|uniref:ester cyclase n=1 Tax=Streptomyces sp. NPDC001185 TaxID=3154380 RepID=UPI00331FC9BE